MKKTILSDEHVRLGATMTEFHGWLMPLYYSSITEEHHATRQRAGLFDLCHMGRIMIRGKNARNFVNWLTPARLQDARAGQVLYSFLLNERGTPLDDITVYVAEEHFLLVVNASNRLRAFEWISKHARQFEGLVVEDISEQIGMLAVQGPECDRIMRSVEGPSWEPLPYYTFIERGTFGVATYRLISATGYTGERGYEIFVPIESAIEQWHRLLDATNQVGGKAAGLGARDSLRLEAAMPLYGHELSENISPLDAGLGKFVDFEKEDFIGKQALIAQRSTGGVHRIVALEMFGRGPVPRHGFRVLESCRNEPIGHVTSGLFSPTLQKNIALALVDARHAQIGSELLVEIRGRMYPAVVTKKPFYKRSESR